MKTVLELIKREKYLKEKLQYLRIGNNELPHFINVNRNQTNITFNRGDFEFDKLQEILHESEREACIELNKISAKIKAINELLKGDL